MKFPTSSACSPKPEPDPALNPSKQPPARPSSPVGQLSLPMRQLLPLWPACSSKISLPTTTRTEAFHRSATSFRTRPPPCLSVASQPGRGRSGLTPSLPHAHLETGHYKNSLCLEAAQYNSPVSMDLLRLKKIQYKIQPSGNRNLLNKTILRTPTCTRIRLHLQDTLCDSPLFDLQTLAPTRIR